MKAVLNVLSAARRVLHGCLRAFVPFSFGCAVVWVRSQPPMDPNSMWDPQAVESLLCERAELSRISGGVHGWSAVSFALTCGVIKKTQTKFVYILEVGESVSAATLVVSYKGGDPMLRWQDKKLLIIQAGNVLHVIKQAAKIGGVTVEFTRLPVR